MRRMRLHRSIVTDDAPAATVGARNPIARNPDARRCPRLPERCADHQRVAAPALRTVRAIPADVLPGYPGAPGEAAAALLSQPSAGDGGGPVADEVALATRRQCQALLCPARPLEPQMRIGPPLSRAAAVGTRLRCESRAPWFRGRFSNWRGAKECCEVFHVEPRSPDLEAKEAGWFHVEHPACVLSARRPSAVRPPSHSCLAAAPEPPRAGDLPCCRCVIRGPEQSPKFPRLENETGRAISQPAGCSRLEMKVLQRRMGMTT